MYVYVLQFEEKSTFDALSIFNDAFVVAENGGLGAVPITIERFDEATGEIIIDIDGYLPGWFCNVYSKRPLPQLEPYIIKPLPQKLLNTLSGQDPASIVEPP